MTDDEELTKQAKSAKIQIWRSNPEYTATVQQLAQVCNSLDIEKLKNTVSTHNSKLLQMHESIEELKQANTLAAARMSALTERINDNQKLLDEKIQVVERSIHELIHATEKNQAERLEAFEKSQTERFQAWVKEHGEIKQLCENQIKCFQAFEMNGRERNRPIPKTRDSDMELLDAPHVPSNLLQTNRQRNRNQVSDAPVTNGKELAARSYPDGRANENPPEPSAKLVRMFWKRSQIMKRMYNEKAPGNEVEFCWSLIEGQGPAVATFLQDYLVKHCDKVKLSTKERRGAMGLKRYIDLGNLSFRELARVFSQKRMDMKPLAQYLERKGHN